MTFTTVPHALNALVRVNPRRFYALLFRAAVATLQAFAHDSRHLGAELGVTAVLHSSVRFIRYPAAATPALVACVRSAGQRIKRS